MSMFRFGSYHLPNDETTQLAHYGARLLYGEVAQGFAGIVGNRQTGDGETSLIDEKIFPHFDDFMDLVREDMVNGPLWDSGSQEIVQATFGDDVVFVASPQGSYGYLYLSAAVLK